MDKLYSCYKCKSRKSVEAFYKDKSRASGIGSKCKDCVSISFTGIRSNTGKLKHKLANKLRKRIRDITKSVRPSNKDIGCSHEELIEYLQSLFKPGMTWDNYGYGPGKWVIDHVRPISNFLKTGDDPKKANHYTNLAPLWFEENAAKGSKF